MMSENCTGIRIQSPLGTPGKGSTLQCVDGCEIRATFHLAEEVPNPLAGFLSCDRSARPSSIHCWSCQERFMIQLINVSLCQLADFQKGQSPRGRCNAPHRRDQWHGDSTLRHESGSLMGSGPAFLRYPEILPSSSAMSATKL